MDYGPESGNVVHVIPEPWASEQEEEDFRVWNGTDTPSDSNRDQRSKSSTTLDSASSGNSRAKAIGKMFFKTKLCSKFRAGTCPYITNCNFAHSMEELRRPPPNWQDIVAAAANDEDREEFQIPSVASSSFNGESQRSYKGRHCKKFYTEEGCPYGDSCTFLHDEQSKNRESVAISLGPGGYSGGGGGGTGGGGGGGSGAGGGGGGQGTNLKPSNWKTRICNKWEITGYCPFGSKCHFAHGAAELHKYGGGLVESESRDSSSVPPDPKQGGIIVGGVNPKAPADNVVGTVNSVPHSDVHHITGGGVPSSNRPAIIIQRPGQRVHQKWKGPDKISRIYGDWIDDVE